MAIHPNTTKLETPQDQLTWLKTNWRKNIVIQFDWEKGEYAISDDQGKPAATGRSPEQVVCEIFNRKVKPDAKCEFKGDIPETPLIDVGWSQYLKAMEQQLKKIAPETGKIHMEWKDGNGMFVASMSNLRLNDNGLVTAVGKTPNYCAKAFVAAVIGNPEPPVLVVGDAKIRYNPEHQRIELLQD